MKIEKHEETLKEVEDEIESALKDARGLKSHQRRLAFALSLGAINLLEIYFRKSQIMKEGAKINHQWFKRKKETLLKQIEQQLTTPLETVQNIQEALDIAMQIEEKRDELAYGAPATEELFQEKINLYFKLKRLLS